MSVDPLEYYDRGDFELMLKESRRHKTPFVIVNLDIVRAKYCELHTLFPYAKIHYAVKANPSIEVLKLLNSLGSHFDVASIYELDRLLSINVDPAKISYGNTIKKACDIKYAYSKGIRLFVTDSTNDVRNIAREAPGADVFFRILTEGGNSADWPLSRKFGCHPDLATDLIVLAKKLNLNPVGISFHVGSQQREVGNWDSAIAKVRYIFDYMETEGIKLSLINMGGGFPANYISRTNNLETYAKEITRYLKDDFGDELPTILLEPGRSLVGDAGILVSEVVLVSQKSHHGIDKWLYLDAGKFNGLVETWDEAIKYPLYTESPGNDCEDYIIAGPTCDSQDIIYENFRNPLPSGIREGDRVYFFTAGAYTSSYASVEFNGFHPIQTYFVGKR